MATSYVIPIPTPPPGKKIEAKGIKSGLNFTFSDVPKAIILPALSKKVVSSVDNTQEKIYASKQIKAAFAASQIEIFVEGVKISDFEELNPAGNTTAVDNRFGTISNATKKLDLLAGTLEASTSSSTTSTTGADFVYNEVPTGSIDGANTTFMLSRAATPQSSLHLYRNGLLQKRGNTEDYVFINNKTIKFNSGCAPRSGDTLTASYQAGAGATIVSGDAEPPFRYRIIARKPWLLDDF